MQFSSTVFIIIVYYFYYYMYNLKEYKWREITVKTLLEIIKINIAYRSTTARLAMANQQKNYKGSDFGMLWAFIKPALYIGVFYIAISIGFKSSKDIEGLVCPYFIWLSTGMICWFYMQSLVVAGAGCFRKFRLNITKVGLPPETVPVIMAESSLIIHIPLLIAGLILAMCFGVTPSIYWLELPIYMALMFLFSVLWNFATGILSAITVDFLNLLKSISVAIFWLSGILFNISDIPEATVPVMRFNPVSFLVEGYRNAVCRHIWIWEQPKEFLCFMTTFTVFLIIALVLFKRIKPRLSDIL